MNPRRDKALVILNLALLVGGLIVSIALALEMGERGVPMDTLEADERIQLLDQKAMGLRAIALAASITLLLGAALNLWLIRSPRSWTLGLIPPARRRAAEPDLHNFTPRAQQVLALARKQADRLHHRYVGTEHVLLGLIELGQGVAVNVLRRLGVDPDAVRREVERCVGIGPDDRPAEHIPYTPRVKKVLALADKESRELHHTYLGSEHILLGLLREGEGVAAQVLMNLGIDTDRARREILRELDPSLPPDLGQAT